MFKPRLPRPNLKPVLKTLVARTEPLLPFRLKSTLAESILNRLLQEPLRDGELDFLEGRLLGLEVRDLGLKLAFSCRDEQLQVLPAEQCDAWIKGDSETFLLMVNQTTDPDTLFFQRQLLIEGDTELGLAVKNLLDSVDWSEMPPLFQRGMQLVHRFA